MGLKEELAKINNRIDKIDGDEEKKNKQKKVPFLEKLRWPFFKKMNRSKLKQGYVSAILIRENNEIDFVTEPVKDGAIMIDEQPYVVNPHYYLTYKGKPVIILPEGSTHPYDPREQLNLTEALQRSTRGHRVILHKMKTEQIDIKKKLKLSGAVIFGLVIAMIVGYYLIAGGTG